MTVKCGFSIISPVSLSLILSLIINNSTKCFLFNAYDDTLTSLSFMPSLILSSFSFIFRNPLYSNIVIEISRLSFSNCSIFFIFGGNSILSIFNHSRFNKFLDILFGCFLSI